MTVGPDFAVVTDGQGGVRVESVTIPAPGRHDVVVSIHASGICHTDIDAITAATGRWVPGHEGAGIVDSVGVGVTDIHPGQRVLLTWAIGCGACHFCIKGSPVHCSTLGRDRGGADARPIDGDGVALPAFFSLGTMATRTVVRREAVVPIPVSLDFTGAALMGCGVMTGYGSVVNAARVPRGSSVVVIGCGGVGLNVVQAARISGADRIFAVDVDAGRLERASTLGATDTLLALPDDSRLLHAAGLVFAATGVGADYAFECTGVPELALSPLAMIAHGGTAVQVSGVERAVEVDMELFEWDKTYLNPLYGMCRPERDFPALFDLHARGLLHLEDLRDESMPLAAASDGMRRLREGARAKIVLVP